MKSRGIRGEKNEHDAALGIWHVVWMQPASGEFVHLTGGKAGDQIVLESFGPNPAGRQRWSFAEITPTTFFWKGEASYDNGATWRVEQEMRAVRRRDS